VTPAQIIYQRGRLHETAIHATGSTPIAKLVPRRPLRSAKVGDRGCHQSTGGRPPTAWDSERGSVRPPLDDASAPVRQPGPMSFTARDPPPSSAYVACWR
jgi:hypothetical protein